MSWPYIDPDLAATIGIFCGYLAVVIALVWRDPTHCRCCSKNIAKTRRNHK